MSINPEILKREMLAKTRCFAIEQIQLRFSNGEQRTYERLKAPAIPAVMMVPMLNRDTVLLIREFSGGTENYQLTLPKGAMDPGETVEQAANRELMEEVGYGAKRFTRLKGLTLSPGYMQHSINLLLAEDLYEQRLPGDEPEPLEVIEHRLEDMDALLERPDCTEARALAALYMVRDLMRKKSSAE